MEKTKVPVFQFTPEFINPINLAEYAVGITGIQGISVFFTKSKLDILKVRAMVDVKEKTIYLPILDYVDQLDLVSFRIIRALLCHECAHIINHDYSYVFYGYRTREQRLIEEFAQTFDDLRIETLIGMEHEEIREEFRFMIETFWLENYAIPPIRDTEIGYGRFGDFSHNLLGSLYWLLQKRYRRAYLSPPPGCSKILPFKPVRGMEALLEREIAPLLDPFVVSREPALKAAEQVLELLVRSYPVAFYRIDKQ